MSGGRYRIFLLTATGVDPGVLFQAFLMAYGGKGLVTPDGKLHIEEPPIREAAIKAIEKLAISGDGQRRSVESGIAIRPGSGGPSKNFRSVIKLTYCG